MAGVVVGVDGSAHAGDALRFALEEARIRGCELTVVEVWQLPYTFIAEEVGADVSEALDASAREHAEQQLRAQVDKALDGRPAPESMRLVLRAGNPPEVLLELGRTADLLVVGAWGRGGFRHLLTGSVASQLVSHAPCPVVIVPPTQRPQP